MSQLLVAGAVVAVALVGSRPLRVPSRAVPTGPPPATPPGHRRRRLARRAGRQARWRRGAEVTRTAARRPLAVLVVGLAFVVDPLLVPVVAVVVWSAPSASALVAERRRRTAVARAVPVGIELLVLAVHAGLTPRQAVSAMVDLAPPPLRPAFADAVTQLNRGRPLAEAVHALSEAIGPEWGPVSDQLAAAEREGAPLALVLTRLADEARRHRRFRAEADARRLPVRLAVPLVVCILPAFVLVAIAPAVLAALSSLGDPAW